VSKKMGRPRKELEWDTFEKLCELQCTEVEIAGFFECSVDTIERRVKEQYNVTFAELYAQKKGKGKASLRRLQWQTAEGGNAIMQIFLGKQYLEQRDKSQVEQTGKDGGPIEHSIIAALRDRLANQRREAEPTSGSKEGQEPS